MEGNVDESAVGIYFSANDRVRPWAYAFLASVRASNPSLPVFLIPFNDDYKLVSELQDEFQFSVFCDDSFPALESIGASLETGCTPTGPFWFRRFAAFWGPFDRFVYLDCRTLALGNLNKLIEAVDAFGFDLLHYDCALDQVYELGDVRRRFLLDRRGRGFNSGRWVASKGLFTLEELVQYGQECVSLREQMNPRNTDQFFLNYCCDRKGLKTGHFADVLGDMCQDAWARQPGYIFRAGDGFRRWDHGGLNHLKRVPLIHWAGIKLSPAMPEAELFYRYHDSQFGSIRRFVRRIGRSILRPVLRCTQALRANRWINQTYHAIRGK